MKKRMPVKAFALLSLAAVFVLSAVWDGTIFAGRCGNSAPQAAPQRR